MGEIEQKKGALKRILPIFTRAELYGFWVELNYNFRAGIRAPACILGIVINLVGVAVATWFIPLVNDSETSAETFGIYVLGVLVPLFAASMLAWKKADNDSANYARALTEVFIALTFLLTIVAGALALKWPLTVHGDSSGSSAAAREWKSMAKPALFFILVLAVIMNLILSGYDSSPPAIGVLDTSPDAVRNKAQA